MELQNDPLESWIGKKGEPVIISGPCSAESPQQVLDTAQALASSGKVHLLRAGIWKPRTRPGSFQGVGTQGLSWLKAAGDAVGLPVITEVANAHHVEACLEHRIDALWIGARTTVNPFSVQEIADALKGVSIPVLVKNPINPDLALWIGALERMDQAGIKHLGAIHRGFSSYNNRHYRNAPNWEIPIELKTLVPGLPIFCDPSHISGRRDGIHEVAQKALDLDMEGLMIESHIQPDAALSDAQQQLAPDTLSQVLESLQFRSSKPVDQQFDSQLEMFRSRIDEIDQLLVSKLAERMGIVEEIGAYKHENNLTILQLERWREILATRTDWASRQDLDTTFIRSLLKVIHEASIARQTQVMNRPPVND
ncbi:MAG: chorismate mutase [Salibacteraceae bacterium]